MLTGYVPPARIVVVDDDEDDRMLLGLAFGKAAPYLPVTYLSDGDEAIAYLAACQETPALLITDLNMPLVGGLELLTHIRQRSPARMMPTVVLTTSTGETDRRQCYQAGANAYLVKPARMSDCVELIHSLVRVWVNAVAAGASHSESLNRPAYPGVVERTPDDGTRHL